VVDNVEDFLQIHEIDLDPASPAYRKLSFEFLKSAVKATVAIEKRHQGEVIETPAAPTPPAVARLSRATLDGMDLMSLFHRWLGERNPPTKTVLDFTTAIRRFTELHGNLPVPEITKAHVRVYKDALSRVPRSCSGKMRNMTLPQVLEHLDASPAPAGATLSPVPSTRR
jgi:hypothetical protein